MSVSVTVLSALQHLGRADYEETSAQGRTEVYGIIDVDVYD